MFKAIFGILAVLVFIWVVRRAWVIIRGYRKLDNAAAKLESVRIDRELLNMEDIITEVKAGNVRKPNNHEEIQ